MAEGDDDEGGLARHVWEQYTNSKTDLTKARERRENISNRSKPLSLLEMTSESTNTATAPKATEESKTADKKPQNASNNAQGKKT